MLVQSNRVVRFFSCLCVCIVACINLYACNALCPSFPVCFVWFVCLNLQELDTPGLVVALICERKCYTRILLGRPPARPLRIVDLSLSGKQLEKVATMCRC
jgi:hypothetical protein